MLRGLSGDGGLGLGTFHTPNVSGKAFGGISTFHFVKLLSDFFQGVVPDLIGHRIQLR